MISDSIACDVVLLGSGLWNVRPPMIMRTFAEGLDFTGRTVLPVVTYAVRGEEVNQAGDAVSSWLPSR